MDRKRHAKQEQEIDSLLDRLKKEPDTGRKMLDLAAALDNQGRGQLAAYVERQALRFEEPTTIHRWRLIQSRRAPANQFLLLNNDCRTAAFSRALIERVGPGDLVLEIGTGSGILAMLAARAGANQVVTCEHQGFMAQVAGEIIRDNHLEKKIRVVPKRIQEFQVGIELPRRADTLVSDLFTGALLDAGGLKLVHYARRNLVREEGSVLPAKATLRGRLVGGADMERLCRTQSVAGFDLSRFNVFSPPVVQISPERFTALDYQTFSPALDLFHFNFDTLEGFEPRKRALNIQSTGRGEIAGLLQWLKLEVSPGNVLESDEQSSISWGRYLHVFPDSIRTESAEVVRLHLEHDWTRFSVWPDTER